VNASERVRVAVVFGGRSNEHAISCVSAGSILRNLDPQRFEVVAIGITPQGSWVLTDGDPDALAITNRAVLAVYRPLLEPLGLTHPQYLVMLALWDNEKSSSPPLSVNSPPLSVKQIAALLQMDSATLSPMLKRLQAQGLINRSRSAAGRVVIEETSKMRST